MAEAWRAEVVAVEAVSIQPERRAHQGQRQGLRLER